VLSPAQRDRAEFWIPAAVALSLVTAAAMDAAVRYFWVDEILTTTLIRDPSPLHMVRALANQVDTSPPLYYLVAWGWARVFGASAYSLRILSALFAAAAFAILWRTLRPYASVATRAAMACSALLLPHIVLAQIAEARAYGLFIALCALSLYQLDLLARDERPKALTLVAVALTQAALVLTHTLGLMYGASALAALVLSDLIQRRARIANYLAWGAGWLAFVAWLPALRRQSEVGLPSFPIPRPTVSHLATGLALGIQSATLIFVLVLLVIAVAVARRSEPEETPPLPPRRRYLPLTLAALSWIAAALVLWIASRVGRPLFLPRYLIPLALSYAVLGTFALQYLLVRARHFARERAALHAPAPPATSYVWLLATVIGVAMYEPVWRADHLPASNRPGGDSLEVHFDLPIATLSTHTYLPREQYAAHPERYTFILDWRDALAPDSPVGPTEFKLMQAMGREYPDHHVEDGEHFLATHSRFLVIDEAGLFWYKRRVAPDTLWSSRLVYSKLLCGSGLPEDQCPVYLVERR
jgi:hypothetical protein